MDLWFTEKQTPDLGLSFQLEGVLHKEQTPYQELAVVYTRQYGRMLVLDGMVQTTEEDEFVYHEMIAHVALFTHPKPKRVAVVGGGDGGAIREILKHPGVQKAVLAEIDERVIAASKEYLPSISSALDDPRVEIAVGDGMEHIRNKENYYDVILIDSTEPVGAAIGLFSPEFYRSVHRALTGNGIMVAQTESPFVNGDLLANSFQAVQGIFPITRLYLASIPTYPSGLWSFTMGSKVHDPLTCQLSPRGEMTTKYYNFDLHRACFTLPNFVRDLLKL
ncbi:MAG: polyamine aminopropyltransferase [Limnochordia bacterium]|jgi:spermidine synthase